MSPTNNKLEVHIASVFEELLLVCGAVVKILDRKRIELRTWIKESTNYDRHQSITEKRQRKSQKHVISRVILSKKQNYISSFPTGVLQGWTNQYLKPTFAIVISIVNYI